MTTLAGGLEGRLTVRVRWDGERIVSAAPISTRPVHACRVLEGRRGDAALAMVPRLFSLCARAQTATAALALSAAGASCAVPDPDRAVAVESVLESLWRLLHDLPLALDEPPRIERFAQVRQALLEDLAGTTDGQSFAGSLAELGELLVQEVLGNDGPGDDLGAHAAWLNAAPTPVAAWLGKLEASGLSTWGTGVTPLMPARPGNEALLHLAGCLAEEEDFTRQPVWLGRPVETGALALRQDEPLVRQLRAAHGHGCATRLAARLVDLRHLYDGLAGREPLMLTGSTPLGSQAGLGWAHTARGLLLHRVTLNGEGRIASYRVLAPTEWNFHPAGALARGLEAQPATRAAELRRGVTLAVLALDPCVDFEVGIEAPGVAPDAA